MAKILVVDDLQEILDFSKEFFEDAGFEVRTAADAPGAIKTQTGFRADVILQDLDVPGGGGIFVYETLRANKDMSPIIFSTGKPESITNIAGMTNVSVLKKPTHPEALMAEVRKQLAAKAAPAERPMNPNPPPPPPPRRPA